MGHVDARLVRCEALSLGHSILFDGQMDGCKFRTQPVALSGVVAIGPNTPRFRRCEFEAGSASTDWILAEGTGTDYKMSHCAMNSGGSGFMQPSTSNLLTAGSANNMTDPNFTVE